MNLAKLRIAVSLALPAAVIFKEVHGFTAAAVRCQPGRRETNVAVVAPSLDDGVDRSSSALAPPDMESYAEGYKTVWKEVPCSVCRASEGKIPEDLVGTYFRSGPAMFLAGSVPLPQQSVDDPQPEPGEKDRMVKHPFEGDGAVLGVTFSGDGTATARFRYVRTSGFINERRKGARLYTGMDSTRERGPAIGGGQGNDFPLPMYRHHLQPGLNKNRKNTSNTRAVYWSKKLLTLWEGGLPYKLDALALSTEGRSQLGGVLKETTSFGSKAAYDPTKERMVFYSTQQDARSSTLTLYEFNSKFRLAFKSEHKLPGFLLVSDFAVTANYAIFVQPPITTNAINFLLSKEPGKTLRLDSRAALLHLIPRREGSPVKTMLVPFDGVSDGDLQFCNAHEDEGGQSVIIDVIRSDGRNVSGTASSWPWAQSLQTYADSSSKKSLWRYTVGLSDNSVEKREINDIHASFGVVNPLVSGKKHRFVFASVGSRGKDVAPPQGIARFDVRNESSLQLWFPEEYEFCGEPMFAPRNNKSGGGIAEDDGYIISVLFDGRKRESEIIVFCADDISAGPVARVPLGFGVPHGYHGCFHSEAAWSHSEIDRRAKLADKIEKRGNMWNEVKSEFSGLGLRTDDIEEFIDGIF